jgi:hypothetical protein
VKEGLKIGSKAMKMDVFRASSVISSGFLLVAVFFLFFLTPYIGSAYKLVTGKLGTALPLLTRDFSLALLGTRENPFSNFSERAVWAYCLWLILFCCPIVLMVWAIRASEFKRYLPQWCLCMITYLSLTIAVAVVTMTGLSLPFLKLD